MAVALLLALAGCMGPPEGTLSAGGWVVCVADGPESRCRAIAAEEPRPRDGQEVLPDGDWIQLAPGFRHTDGHVHCWGRGYAWFAEPFELSDPVETFRTVTALDSGACGLSTDGLLKCWGQVLKVRGAPDAGGFVEVRAQGPYACGLTGDGQVRCWSASRRVATASWFERARMRTIAVTADGPCGITREDGLVCEGFRKDGPWDQIAAGPDFVCGRGPSSGVSTTTGATSRRSDGEHVGWPPAGVPGRVAPA